MSYSIPDIIVSIRQKFTLEEYHEHEKKVREFAYRIGKVKYVASGSDNTYTIAYKELGATNLQILANFQGIAEDVYPTQPEIVRYEDGGGRIRFSLLKVETELE